MKHEEARRKKSEDSGGKGGRGRRERRKKTNRKKTEAARIFFLFSASYSPCCLALAGAKDASDLKRYEKEHGVLGVNLGSSLSAGGGLTLHQELIMTMPGAGKLAFAKRLASLRRRINRVLKRGKERLPTNFKPGTNFVNPFQSKLSNICKFWKFQVNLIYVGTEILLGASKWQKKHNFLFVV